MEETITLTLTRKTVKKDFSTHALRITGILLVALVWISAGLFGLYMLAFYAADWYGNNLENWNKILPGLYQKQQPLATTGIGLHFATGGMILSTIVGFCTF